MSENKSPVESMKAEFIEALAELQRVGEARQSCLERWSDMRRQLQKNGALVSLTRHFEAETTVLTELTERYTECQRKVRLIDGKMAGAQQKWALQHRMEFSRSRA
jgi:chromosome segregation ATPase